MIPKISSSNEPLFEYRGFMLDTVRHCSSTPDILRILEQMAELKLNVLHLHLSNDQGYRLESKRFPRLNEIASFRTLDEQDPLVERGISKAGELYGGFYTCDDIKTIIEFARQRGITVVPEIEMPGHAAAILAAYPEYSCSGKTAPVASSFGIHDRVFCVGKEDTYKFIFTLLDEVCELFDSPYIHIGGDETPKDAWRTCPHCQRLMREKELHSYEQLQAYFTNQIISHLKKKNKQAIVWNESAYDECLDGDAIVQYWMEMSQGESYMPKELSRGRRIILSNQNPFYFDYSYAETPMRALLNYKPNVKGISVPRENILGVEAALWTEWLPLASDREKMIMPRLLAFSEYTWNPEIDIDDFLSRAREYVSDGRGILLNTPWDEAELERNEALKQIAKNMLTLSARHAKMAEKEGRAVRASVHDDDQKADPAVQVFEYMKAKMLPAYTEEDVKKVLYYLSEMRK